MGICRLGDGALFRLEFLEGVNLTNWIHVAVLSSYGSLQASGVEVLAYEEALGAVRKLAEEGKRVWIDPDRVNYAFFNVVPKNRLRNWQSMNASRPAISWIFFYVSLVLAALVLEFRGCWNTGHRLSHYGGLPVPPLRGIPGFAHSYSVSRISLRFLIRVSITVSMLL